MTQEIIIETETLNLRSGTYICSQLSMRIVMPMFEKEGRLVDYVMEAAVKSSDGVAMGSNVMEIPAIDYKKLLAVVIRLNDLGDDKDAADAEPGEAHAG